MPGWKDKSQIQVPMGGELETGLSEVYIICTYSGIAFHRVFFFMNPMNIPCTYYVLICYYVYKSIRLVRILQTILKRLVEILIINLLMYYFQLQS